MLDRFILEFEPKLGMSKRWPAFVEIASRLSRLNRPVHIGETGCARLEGNWIGDGQSTLLWDFIAKETGGTAFSVDVSEESCRTAKRLCQNVEVIKADSLWYLALASLKEKAARLDLLYLDSFDFNPPYVYSALHHAGELAATYHKLPSGCLVAVDDCHRPDFGKHLFVKAVFDSLGIPPILEGYITVWQKP